MIANLWFWITTFLCKFAMTRNTHINGFDFMLPRSAALLFMSFCDVSISRVNVFNVSLAGLKLLIARATIAAFGMPWYFIALKYLPMSQASIIVNLAPLLVPILAYFVLRERIDIVDIIALFFGFGGWVLINLTKANSSDESVTYDGMYLIGIWLWMVGLAARTLVPVTLRLLSVHLHPIWAPVYFSFGVTCFSLACLLITPTSFHFQYWTKIDIGLFFMGGMVNYGEQRFMTLAMKYGKASILVPVTYINIAMLLIIDLTLFKYSFEYIYFLGFFVIVVSVLTPILIRSMQ